MQKPGRKTPKDVKERRDRICKMYLTSNVSLAEIAQSEGVSTGAVHQWVTKYRKEHPEYDKKNNE